MTSRLPLRAHPRPIRGLGHRLIDSPAARDLLRFGPWPLFWAAILVLSILVALLTRGMILTWDGWITVPTEPAAPVGNLHCGDYCGTDAGLITEPATP